MMLLLLIDFSKMRRCLLAASPIQAWNCCTERDQEVPEVHRAPDPQASFPKAGA